MTLYYEYARYRSQDRADDALEQMYADGEVCAGERPFVKKVTHKTASWSKAHTYWAVMLPEMPA